MKKEKGFELQGGIVRGFSAIAASTAALALFGLAREAVVAMSFGASSELDAFLFSFSLVYFVPVILSSTLQGTFIPAFYRARQLDPALGDKLGQLTLNALLLTLIGSGFLLSVFGPMAISFLAPGFNEPGRTLAFSMLLSLMPTLILIGINEQLKNMLNAVKVFAFPALTQILPSATTILALLVGSRRWGVAAFAVGWNLGMFLQTISLAWSFKRSGGSFSFSFDLKFAEFRVLLRNSLPYLFVPLTANGILLVDKYFASLVGPGAISYFNYAEKLFRIPWMMIGGALFTVALPYFSEKAATRDYEPLRRTISHVLALAIFLTIPVAVAMVILGEPISVAIFQRGAFTHEDASRTSMVLIGFMASLLFYALSYILDRALCALGKTTLLMKLAAFTLLFKVLLAWGMTEQWSLLGLSLSTAPALFLQTAAMYLILRKGIGHLDFPSLLTSFTRVTAASGIMAVFLYFSWSGITGHEAEWEGSQAGKIYLVGIILAGALIYWLVALLLKSWEAGALLQMIRDFRMRGSAGSRSSTS